MSVSFNGRRDPSLPCRDCRQQWLIGAAAQWDSGVLTDGIRAARDAGWLVKEYGENLCPKCNVPNAPPGQP